MIVVQIFNITAHVIEIIGLTILVIKSYQKPLNNIVSKNVSIANVTIPQEHPTCLVCKNTVARYTNTKNGAICANCKPLED